MNERIKDLMIQSGAYDHYEINEGVDGDELPMVKFAELIVKECSKYIEDKFDFCGDEIVIAESVLKHFGVEE